MMKSLCPICEEIRDVQIEERIEVTQVKGVPIEAISEYSICTFCKNEFVTGDQMDRTLTNAYDIYRQMQGLVSPDRIISIRSRYNASQKAFAKILDLGELTINSFEQGSLPSKSVSNLIKLMEKPENFVELFGKNKDKLSRHQIGKIEHSLLEQKVPIYSIDLDNNSYIAEKHTGYNRPDWEKVISLFQLILHFSQKKLYKMALLKIAFYVDFTCFKRNVRSMTGWPYAAISHGPVPEDWKDILYTSEESKRLFSEPDDMEMGDLYSLTEDFDFELVSAVFTNDEIRLVQEVTTRLKDKTATELRGLTHEEDAWKKTSHASKIDYRHAETLRLF